MCSTARERLPADVRERLPADLRQAARIMAETNDPFPTGQSIMNDAADEIERLREDLSDALSRASENLDRAMRAEDALRQIRDNCTTAMVPASVIDVIAANALDRTNQEGQSDGYL